MIMHTGFERPKGRGRVCGNLIALLAGIFTLVLITGCELRLQALILSPGQSEIEVAQGETVYFSGTAIGGIPFSNGTETTYGYSWNTDKNSQTALTGEGAAESGVEVAFDKVGVFNIVLTVSDSQGNTDRATVRVNVKSGVDSGQPLQSVILSPAVSPIQVVVGRTLTFKGIGAGGVPYFTDSDAVDEPYGYFWNIPGIKNVTVKDNQRDVDVTFSATGVFNLFFTVKDSRGAVDTAAVQVTVIPE